jgi:protein CLEC16A
MDCVTAQESNL